MTRDEILPLARKHGFAGCEVGFRMVSLINEILALNSQDVTIDELHARVHENDQESAE